MIEDGAGEKIPAAKTIEAKTRKHATGTDSPALQQRLLKQVIESLWIPENASEDDKLERVQSAYAILQGISPADEIEGMLAAQMVGVHTAAMECLRRAMFTNQTFAGFEQSLKNAVKLLAIFARQLESLNKHRGKGQQKVTVEYVNVEAGGQAVVGNVETSQNRLKPSIGSKNASGAITHAPRKTLDLNNKARTPSKLRNK